jgi:hypothetical protein
MKFILVLLSFVALLFVASLVSAQTNPCNGIGNSSVCWDTSFQGKACVWCESKAVPSNCASYDQAVKLPSAVFICTTESGQVVN